jgi:hypothetical protein
VPSLRRNPAIPCHETDAMVAGTRTNERRGPAWQYLPVMRRIVLLAGIAIVLAACGNMLNPEGRTATPSPSPLPSGVANINPSGDETLPAGRYTRHDFVPRVIFEIDDQWIGGQIVDGFFVIHQGDEEDPDIIAVQFARPDAIYGADGAAQPTDAADAVAILETHPNIEVVETSTSQMAGLEGSQITLESTGVDPEDAEVMDLPPGTIGINPDRRLWIAFFDTDDGLLAIMVSGSTEQWDEALAVAEPVLESVDIEQD